MTSRSLFWDSCRENHKRRIWVWIVAVLSQLVAYGGMTMIYLSRIKGLYANGSYNDQARFSQDMYQAAQDALGFSDNLFGIVLLLAAMIAMQGFSYLYDRRKVDLYHSVPVSKNKRFAVVYINGLFIYLTANLLGLILGVVIAASQSAVNAEVLAEAGLAFVWNLAFFLVYYHLMILAVMLTGNRFVTICVFLAFLLYEIGAYSLLESLKRIFFETYSGYYLYYRPKLSPFYDCTANVWQIKNASDSAEAARLAMPFAAKWIGIAVVVLAVTWIAYRKRASEAAGKAIAYRFLEPVLKVAVAIMAAFVTGQIVYDSSYESEPLLVIAMLVGALIVCAAMEVVYDFDIRSLCKHLVSSGVALIGVLAIFFIFKWDLFGYDSYVPEQNKIDSIAICADGYYDNYWDENGHYIGDSEYQKENMFLTDAEPVLALVKKAEQMDEEEMKENRAVQILYRLKSGREAARMIRVDYDDPETEALLNQIFRTEAFKKGTFQAITDETSYDQVFSINYTNGAANTIVPKEEARGLRDAWVKDMEQFDFTLVRHNRPCGILNIAYGVNRDYVTRQYYVYDSFENTINYLKKYEAYYPVELNAADIDSITVNCYHHELTLQLDPRDPGYQLYQKAVNAVAVSDVYVDYTVRETFYEEGQIAQILPHIYPAGIDAPWSSYGADTDDQNNYYLEIVFKKDSAYPYERGSYYFSYNFRNGEVPDFVVEATAYKDGMGEESVYPYTVETVSRRY
ncbi:MAG: hypothetical protein K2N43_04160 [Lachnospiraceae bacterium]|nr:hypothetical protein [Lachnospiraceae bacterium]